MKVNVDIDFDSLELKEIDNLLHHLLHIRNERINNLGDAGKGNVSSSLAFAYVNNMDRVELTTVRPDIAACIGVSSKIVAPNRLSQHLEKGERIVLCHVLPVSELTEAENKVVMSIVQNNEKRLYADD